MTQQRFVIKKCTYCTVEDMLKPDWCGLKCQLKDIVRELDSINSLSDKDLRTDVYTIDDLIEKYSVGV